ncbi:MAG: DnaJ domain-containing protein, partial [Desulfobacterales bacterium]
MWKIILLILAGLYTLNPYDIVPDVMVGWGWLDDLIIWVLVWRYFVSLKKKLAATGRYYQSSDGGFNKTRSGNFSGQSRSDSNDQFSEDSDQQQWDAYRVLGIDRSASIQEIKHAYRELAAKYHPDKLEHLGDEFKVLAETRFK